MPSVLDKKQVKTTKKVKNDSLNHKKNYKNHCSDDDDDDNNDQSDDNENSSDTDNDDQQQQQSGNVEYQKMLSKMFPSKYMSKKVKDLEKGKKQQQQEHPQKNKPDTKEKNKLVQKKIDTKEDESDSENENDTGNKKRKKSNKSSHIVTKPKKKEKVIESFSSETNESSDSDNDNDDDSSSSSSSSSSTSSNDRRRGKNKLNIIFTIGGGNEEDDEWETDDDYDEDEDDEWFDYEEDEESEEEEDDDEESGSSHDEKESKKQKPLATKEDSEKVLKQLKEIQDNQKGNKVIQKCIDICETDIKLHKKKQEKLEKKQKTKNSKVFRKIIRDKNTMNDFQFFNKLELGDQTKILKELKEINKIIRVEKPYRLTLLESSMPTLFKAAALKKISTLRYMEPGSGEYYKIKNWVDTFMRMPFDKYVSLPISMSDGVDQCHEFMASSQKTLNDAVYGLNDAKMQIMQMLGQLITNPKSIGTSIAIHGPPGTGKCHTYDTPILMYDGTIKMVQDIVVGDTVMGDDSTPRKVIDLGRGKDELFEIIPTKGEKFGVNSAHILCLKQSGLNKIKKVTNKNNSISYKVEYLNKLTFQINSKRFDNLDEAQKYLDEKNIENDIFEISVKDLLHQPKSITRKLKGYRSGVEFETRKVLFDPYVLGVWLGDGTSSQPQITNQDATILSYVRNSIKEYGLNLNYYSGYTYRIAYDMHDNDSRNNKNMFLQALKDYKLLNNKHIPHDIKVNDRSTRMQVLAGIIDTDGSYSLKDKCFSIFQKNKTLSDDILFVARSLGFAAYQKKCNQSCLYKGEKVTGEYYRISISGDNLCEIPTKCPRKKAVERLINKNALLFGFDIKPIGHGNYYGFTLDNNHRYVLHDFTVTHNTSLVKEGISKILNRPFAFIALGGATDSSFLEGHSYTYEGSTWGKIVQILIDSKCMNPVIYFDELDKISDTPKGEEIAGILTHLTDTTQNTQFHDKYFAEIDFDLSKCLFIFSYNDESKINPILKDRMYRIQTKGYNQKQKTVIANNYLLPKIREQVVFKPEDVLIPDETLHYIIDNLCNKEDGVRNLKRCLEIIHTKLNLYRLMKDGKNLFEEDMNLVVKFPFTVTKDVVDKLIKRDKDHTALYNLYI